MKKSKKESKLTLEDLINDTYTLSKYIKNIWILKNKLIYK